MSSTLSSSKSERWLSFETLQRQWAYSSMQGRILWVVWSCGRKLRVPLELCVDLGDLLVSPQGSQISFGFVIGASGFLMHCSRDR